mgnify:CR=1 FL=1
MAAQTPKGNLPVVVLKHDANQVKGREAQKNNIAAAKIIADIVHTSLGPKGMDKMLVDSLGDVTITNDGATILKEIDVQHPAAKMMVEISKTVDNEVGDGTTSSVVFGGTLLAKAEELIKKDFDDNFTKVDAILTPSTPSSAFKIGEKTNDPVSMYLNDIFTVPVNLAGLPAISVPAGLDKKGYPLGLQLIGKTLDEQKILNIAYAFEKNCGYKNNIKKWWA